MASSAPSATLSIPYRQPQVGPRELLLIEQEPWDAYTGTMTNQQVADTVGGLLYGRDPGITPADCGLTPTGDLRCTVHVYPLVPGLLYQFACTHGVLSPRYEQERELVEILNFELVSSVRPKYPPLAIHSARWLAEVYDASGSAIPAPPLLINGQEITTSPNAPIYGSVEVRSTTLRHTYLIDLPRREDAVANHYSATCYAWYEGGVQWLILEPPPGISALESGADNLCTAVAVSPVPPEDDPHPTADGAHRRTVVDYCKQTILEDTYL